MEKIELPKKSESILNDWDRKYLAEGAKGVIQHMYSDFDGDFPDVILLPETAARPLAYLFDPIFKKLQESKNTKIPKFVFFNASRNPYGLQAYLERRSENAEIRTAEDFEKAAAEFNASHDDADKIPEDKIGLGLENGEFEKTAVARDAMKERADEIQEYLSANPDLKMAILDDFHGYQISLDEVKRALGSREIHAYSLGSTPNAIDRGDGEFEAKSGYVFKDSDDANPGKQKPNGENAIRFSYALTPSIGVTKSYDSKYAEPIRSANPVEADRLANEKALLREEMKSIGTSIADSIAESMSPVDGIMTWEEYAKADHPTPYVFELKNGDKKLTYFGAMHSNDPSNPMFEEIKAKFAEARPDSVFVEGWAHLEQIKADPERYVRGTEAMKNMSDEEVIQKYGEAGLGLKLAIDAGIDFYSPEPKFSDEIAHVLKQGFTKEEVFAEYVHRDLYQYYRNKEKTPVEEYLNSTIIQTFKDASNWDDFDYSIAHLEKISEEIWGDKGDIRVPDFSSQRTSPVPEEEFVTRITGVAQASSKFRDVYMVKELKKALKTHNRPFIIFGASHAYMQESALKNIFDAINKK